MQRRQKGAEGRSHHLERSRNKKIVGSIPTGGSNKPFPTSQYVAVRPTFDLGREVIETPGSALRVGIYSPERCIAGAFRLRGDLGYELGRDALREWIRRGGKPAAHRDRHPDPPSQGSDPSGAGPDHMTNGAAVFRQIRNEARPDGA